MPWTGITVNDLGTNGAGHLTFSAGPTHQIDERLVRNTARPPFHADGTPNPSDSPTPFTIGPVDFPDTARDQAATGALFLNSVRGYSGTGPDNVEHYCLDCSFRPWLDATGTGSTGALHAVVIYSSGGRVTGREELSSTNGSFSARHVLAPGEAASVRISDAWGDQSPVVSRSGV